MSRVDTTLDPTLKTTNDDYDCLGDELMDGFWYSLQNRKKYSITLASSGESLTVEAIGKEVHLPKIWSRSIQRHL